MFIGRENEQKLLIEKIESNKFEFGIVYGRRRVGKTSLLNHVLKEKKGIYYVASEMSYEHNIRELSKVIGIFFNEPVQFNTLEDIFKYLISKSKYEKITLIIDEFTYLMSQTPGILSVIQNIVDNIKSENILLILSGSQVGMIEDSISYHKPLYGRATFKMKLQPFDYYEASKFYPTYSSKDKIIMYSVFGGIPYYLTLIDDRKSVQENIENLIIKDTAILRNEVEFILKQELRSIGTYAMILDAIATNSTKLTEISDKAKIGNTGNTSKYLNTLIGLELVEKEIPFGDKENSRKSIYKIADNLVNFFYTFIYSNKSAVNMLPSNVFYEKIVESKLNVYVSYAFEKVAKEFIIRKNKNTKKPFYDIGRYWGNHKELKKEIELDLVASNLNDLVVYECKWTNDKFSLPIYEKLKEHSSILKPTKLGGFSLNGFTKEAIAKLDYYYTPEDLFEL